MMTFIAKLFIEMTNLCGFIFKIILRSVIRFAYNHFFLNYLYYIICYHIKLKSFNEFSSFLFRLLATFSSHLNDFHIFSFLNYNTVDVSCFILLIFNKIQLILNLQALIFNNQSEQIQFFTL